MYNTTASGCITIDGVKVIYSAQDQRFGHIMSFKSECAYEPYHIQSEMLNPNVVSCDLNVEVYHLSFLSMFFPWFPCRYECRTKKSNRE
jgi:hypothetical protein